MIDPRLTPYARWRMDRHGPDRLGEPRISAPPERLLQAAWHHQRLRREKLRTVDGRSVCILHPGFWNREAGPDFRAAVLRIGDAAPISGDVEIDLQVGDWQGHRHHVNSAFDRVIFHVVWSAPAAVPDGIPTLALENYLDSPWAELAAWLDDEAAGDFPETLRGRCCAPLRDLSETGLRDLLHQAAQVRLRRKAHEFQARAREAGWEQALWEGLFRALGYKHNSWPMLRLAELRPALVASTAARPLEWQARLFGLAGLLPTNLGGRSPAAGEYLRQLWDLWWRERDAVESMALPRSVWRFHGLRPSNHPERRLALASHWLAGGDLGGRIEKWFIADQPPARRASSLLKLLAQSDDPFWSSHWTLRSTRLPAPQPLLGATRVTDLAINAIFPWLLARAEAGRSAGQIERVEKCYFAWHAAEDNAPLRLARRRLLASSQARFPRTAAAQQGLLQIIRDYCDHSNAICDQCGFPDLVRSLHTGGR